MSHVILSYNEFDSYHVFTPCTQFTASSINCLEIHLHPLILQLVPHTKSITVTKTSVKLLHSVDVSAKTVGAPSMTACADRAALFRAEEAQARSVRGSGRCGGHDQQGGRCRWRWQRDRLSWHDVMRCRVIV